MHTMARKFQVARNLGRSVAYSSIDVVSNLMPNTTDLVRGMRSGSDFVRDTMRRNAAKIRSENTQLDRSAMGRKARALFEEAWRDIRQGNLALGDISDQSMSDWEDYTNPGDIVSYSDQRISSDAPDDGQNATVPGFKPIVVPQQYTVQGIQQLGNTLGNVTLKGLEYQTQAITNAILTQMTVQDTHFRTMEKQLDAINKNLVQLVNFQNDSTNRMYQANLAFYDQMTNWMKKYEKRQVEMGRTTRENKPSRMSRFMSSSFFDMSEYGKIIQDNLMTSPIGLLSSMMGFANPEMLGMMMGGKRGKFQPQNFLLNAIVKALIPKGARRSLGRFDSQANSMAKTLLTRLGDMQYRMDENPLLGLLGSIFGIDSRMNRTLRLGRYKRDAMNWNGEAQKALTVVIPKELAEIKAAILKQDAKYFDSSTGSFLSKEAVRARTKRDIAMATESPFANIFNKNSLNLDDVADRRFWSGMQQEVQQEVNRIVNEAVRSSAGMTTELMRALDETISKGISSLNGTQTDVQRMAMALNTAVTQARSGIERSIAALQNQNSAFTQMAVDMADPYGNVSFDTLMDFIGGNSIDLIEANGGGYTTDGRRLDSMSPEERRRYENNMKAANRMRERASQMSKSKNRAVRLAGRAYDRYINYKTDSNPSAYSRKLSGAVDNVSNQIYRVVMKGESLRSPQSPQAATSSVTINRNRYAEEDAGQENVRTSGGIQNDAMQRDNRNDPVEAMADDIREQRDIMDEAWGIKGYMAKVFNSPLFKKFAQWFGNTKVGKATKSGVNRAGNFIKDLFLKDHVDEEGNVTESVKTRMKNGLGAVSDYVLNFLGIDKKDLGDAAGGAKQKGRSVLKELTETVQKKAPKHLFAGVLGAGAGLAMGGSTGLLGSLFLPGGPIGGAIVGMGISMLSETEAFKKMMFGEKDEDGTRSGGIISKELQASFKKVAPSLGLGALAGIALKFIGGAVLPKAVTSTIGFFPSIFLPGGVMGAAILGAAGAFALRNQRVQDALFGKADENGTRTGSFLSGIYNKITGKIRSISDDQNKVSLPKRLMNGLKGLSIGAIAGATLGQLGVLGAAVTPAGPIGAAIVGAATGIVSTSSKFNEYLFGTKDGKERKKDGLFTRFGKMLQLNLFEPAAQYINSTAEELVWHARQAIEVPFRLAFGPILDSFTDMRDSMKETATGTIKAIGEKVGNTVMKILSPIGKTFINMILKPIGKVAGGLIKGGLFAGASMIGAPFQLLALLTSKKRSKAEKQFGDFLNGEGVREDLLGRRWAAQEEAGESTNKFADRLMYSLGTLPGIGKFFRSNELMADMAEYYAQTEEGRNNLDFLGAKADKKRYKRNQKDARQNAKQERKLLRLRQKFASSDKYVEGADISAEEFKKRQKMLKKLGVDIESVEDLQKFTYHYDEWKNPSIAETGQKLSPEGEIQNETKNLVEKILEKLGIIVDLQKGTLDVQTGAQADTEDIDTGDVAETIDEDLAADVQQSRAKSNAQALVTAMDERDEKKAREAEHDRVTGNTSGNAHDETGMKLGVTAEENDQRPQATEEEVGDKKSGDIFDTISSFFSGGSLLGGIAKLLTSKAGLIALLGTAFAAVLSNPDMRQALGNVLGDVAGWLVDAVKGAVGSIPDLLGIGGGKNDQRVLSYDENGEPSEVVLNSGLIENTATLAVKDASTIAKVGSQALSKGSGLLGAATTAISKTGLAKAIKVIPGVKTATKLVSKVASGASKAAGAVKTGASKVGSVIDNLMGTKAGQAAASTTASIAQSATISAAGLFEKALSLLSSAFEKAAKTKIGSKVAPVLTKLSTFFKNILTKVSGKITSGWSGKLIAALGQTGAKVSSWVVPGLNIISAVITAGSTISGILNPERLFKVSDDYVDGKMRLIGGIFNLVTSATGIGAVLAVINDIVVEIMGTDFIQELALTLYHAMASDDESVDIENAVTLMEKEVELYNEANGTNLSVDAYNDLKNKGTWGGIFNSVKNLFGAGDKTDYSQYEDAAREALGMGTGSKSTSKSSNQAIGYGPSTSMQNDPRWGNMQIGRFPNGKKATMATGGCGPTALANAASAVGLGYLPPDVAQMASQRGYLTNGGANANLFEAGASDLGMDSTRLNSANSIRDSLRHGNPVIVAGKSGGYSNDPYTSSGHIVTATSMDKNGNVTVQDPMRGTSQYNVNDLTSNMTHAWSVSRKKTVGYGLMDSLLGSALSSVATGGIATVLSKITGMSYTDAKEKAVAMNATDTSTNATDSENAVSLAASTGSPDIDLSGNSQAEQIRNYLKGQGYTDEAIAGIMGCWQVESSNRADRVEGDYLKSFPGFQTVLASNQALDNYTTDVLFPAYERSNISISKKGYKGTDGHYYPGIGLAQWTGPRGENLFKYANQHNYDWRNLATQLSFFNSEIASRGLKTKLNAASSASDAAHVMLDGYEMYSGYGAKAPSALKKRQDAANSIYNQYKSLGNGKGAIGYGIFDTLLGGAFNTLLSNVYSKFGLEYNADSSSADGSSNGSSSSNGVVSNGETYKSTGVASLDQKNLAKQMASIEGQLNYSQDWDKQDPDKIFTSSDGTQKRYGSCASTVAWAYDKVLGFKPGGNNFARSTYQAQDERFTTIYTNDGKTKVDVSQLQPGDIAYFNWDRTSNNGTMQHTEMYAGNSQNLSHGGNPKMGPVYKDYDDYRKKHTMMVRRYTPFIENANTDQSTSTNAPTSRGGGFGDGTRGAGFSGSVGNGPGANFAVNHTGQLVSNPSLKTVGYGPGTSSTAVVTNNRGVETRLDTIIQLMNTIVSMRKSVGNGPGSTTNNVTVNTVKEEKSSPPIIINQNKSRNLGADDAAHEFLRTRYRKIASAVHT